MRRPAEVGSGPSPRRGRVLASAAAAGVLLAASPQGCDQERAPVVQPIAFSHAIHHAEDMACVDCHLGAEEGVYATIAGIDSCLLCHEEAQGDSPEEARLLEFAERGEPIPWVQVNHVDGHVYFSHAPHVVLGEMECAECHGDMTELDEPPATSQVEWMTMEACMRCHEERQVTNDCLACHK